MNNHGEQNKILVKVSEAAKLLGVSSRTVWRMIADKELNPVRFRHCTRLALTEVMAIINPTGKAGSL